MYLRFLVSVVLACTAVLPGLAVARAQTAPTAGPAFSHVYIIMEENTDYNDIVGNTADAPYLNSLIQQDGFAANYYGVTHPSLPNYVAATAGDFFGSHSDNGSQVFDQPNIVDQLEAHGKTWAGYMQSMPSAGFTGQAYPAGSAALYVNKHDPFVLFKDILDNPTRLQNVKPADQLASDLATGTAPNYVWISPDVCHDMHGMGTSGAVADGMPWCAYPPNDTVAHALIQAGDQYAKQLVSTIMSSKAWTSDSAIVITWDENDYAGTKGNFGYGSVTGCCASPANAGGGRVPAIVITGTPAHSVSLHPYNHYSLLRTVEDAFGLGCLANTCNPAVQPMTDLFNGTGTASPISQTQGFAVSFTSTTPGQGYVYFGPNCNALVEVATNDIGSGTTNHTVIVTGNDMPGTIGDIGLTPGATYAYEAVTSTPAGTQVDNNNGACYTFTVEQP